MKTTLLIDVLGWIGAIMLLYAYIQVSAGRWTGQTKIFQLLNVSGSILFIINSGFHGAYPSVFVNVIWSAVALRTLVLISRAATTRA